MEKYYGTIGFIRTEETSPSVWTEVTTEKKYQFNILKKAYKLESSDSLNDNFTISNQFSVLIDPFLKENLSYIRYLEFMGVFWKVSNVEIIYPRITITLGGIYNGK